MRIDSDERPANECMLDGHPWEPHTNWTRPRCEEVGTDQRSHSTRGRSL